MKKYKITINVVSREDDSGKFSFEYDTLNGGGGYFGSRDEINADLTPEKLNILVRNEHAFNNPFEDVYDYPVVEINDCGRRSNYIIPENEKWRYKETVQAFKTGEIVGCNRYDHEQDREILEKCFVRFKRHNKYYVSFSAKQKGYEYLGFPVEWLDPGQIVRLEGEIISRFRFDRAEDLSGETLEGEPEWDISEISDIEVSFKSCKTGSDSEACRNSECECILPDHIITFKDSSRIKVFSFDARLLSELTRIPIKNTSDPQLSLFEFSQGS